MEICWINFIVTHLNNKSLVLDILNFIIGAERAENRVERSGAERWGGVAEKRRRWNEAGRRVAEIGWSAERLFRRSRSAHILWWGIAQTPANKTILVNIELHEWMHLVTLELA